MSSVDWLGSFESAQQGRYERDVTNRCPRCRGKNTKKIPVEAMHSTRLPGVSCTHCGQVFRMRMSEGGGQS